MSILGYLLLPMQHSPSGWLTSFHREIGSSRLGMVQVPLEEGIQSRNERDPSLQGQAVLAVLDLGRSRDTLWLVPELPQLPWTALRILY